MGYAMVDGCGAVDGAPGRAATINAAQALVHEADVCTIAVGRYADLVAVDGDPFANVRELESVDGVIKGGVVIERAR